MYKILLILFISFFIVNTCVSNETKKLHPNIKGDWVIINTIKTFSHIVFSFEDSLCTELLPTNGYSNYKLSNDTLIIYKKRERNTESKYLILNLSKDKLLLTPLSKETKQRFKRYKLSDTLNFEKIKLKNSVDFQKIGFYSSGCLGSCPSMYLEINNNGTILIKNLNGRNIGKIYVGKIYSKQINIISKKIKAIDLDNLKDFYSANWTCDQTCKIIIKTDKQTYRSGAYGFAQEPIELRILFEKLMEIRNHIKLEKSLIEKGQFYFKNFYNKTARMQDSILSSNLDSISYKDGEYLSAVDEMPKPIGGINAIQSRVVIPELAKKVGIKGKIYIYAYINKLGIVDKTEIITRLGVGCDEAAKEAIMSTRFEPGKLRGELKKVKVLIPISIDY